VEAPQPVGFSIHSRPRGVGQTANSEKNQAADRLAVRPSNGRFWREHALPTQIEKGRYPPSSAEFQSSA
jgi:hypothetical protein